MEKRVLHVVGNMDCNGMETLIMNWYRKIDRSQLQFDFLVHQQKKGFYEDEIIAMGGRVYHLSVVDDKNFVKYVKQLKAFFNQHKEYKVVHGHHSFLGYFYLKAAKKSGVPCRISHSHIASFSRSISGIIKHIVVKLRLYNRFANNQFACSVAAGNYMYGKKAEFRVINNGIDTQRFKFSSEIRNNKRIELGVEGKDVIVHVGRFFDQKNHDFLIDVFNSLHRINEKAVLLLVGTGPLQDAIKNKVSALKLDDYVQFLGNRFDVEEILSASDVFLFPSLYEGLPLTLVEAQTSGLPVICSTAITSETKLTDNYTSISLSESSEVWAEEVMKALNADTNREQAYQIVKKNNYCSADIAQKMQEFYMQNSAE